MLTLLRFKVLSLIIFPTISINPFILPELLQRLGVPLFPFNQMSGGHCIWNLKFQPVVYYSNGLVTYDDNGNLTVSGVEYILVYCRKIFMPFVCTFHGCWLYIIFYQFLPGCMFNFIISWSNDSSNVPGYSKILPRPSSIISYDSQPSIVRIKL